MSEKSTNNTNNTEICFFFGRLKKYVVFEFRAATCARARAFSPSFSLASWNSIKIKTEVSKPSTIP